MRATIDAAGRIVIPKLLREQLGFAAGVYDRLEAQAWNSARLSLTIAYSPGSPVSTASGSLGNVGR